MTSKSHGSRSEPLIELNDLNMTYREGVVERPGDQFEVTGSAWMDRGGARCGVDSAKPLA
jgi:hypothetical protein